MWDYFFRHWYCGLLVFLSFACSETPQPVPAATSPVPINNSASGAKKAKASSDPVVSICERAVTRAVKRYKVRAKDKADQTFDCVQVYRAIEASLSELEGISGKDLMKKMDRCLAKKSGEKAMANCAQRALSKPLDGFEREFVEDVKKQIERIFDDFTVESRGLLAPMVNDTLSTPERVDSPVEDDNSQDKRRSYMESEANTARMFVNSSEGVIVTGTFNYSGDATGQKKIDTLKPVEGRGPSLIHVEEVQGTDFSIEFPKNYGKVMLKGIIDKTGNGPSADDPQGVVTLYIESSPIDGVKLELTDDFSTPK